MTDERLTNPPGHTPIVPGAAGTSPWGSCGWRQPSPRGPYLFEHLDDIRLSSADGRDTRA